MEIHSQKIKLLLFKIKEYYKISDNVFEELSLNFLNISEDIFDLLDTNFSNKKNADLEHGLYEFESFLKPFGEKLNVRYKGNDFNFCQIFTKIKQDLNFSKTSKKDCLAPVFQVMKILQKYNSKSKKNILLEFKDIINNVLSELKSIDIQDNIKQSLSEDLRKHIKNFLNFIDPNYILTAYGSSVNNTLTLNFLALSKSDGIQKTVILCEETISYIDHCLLKEHKEDIAPIPLNFESEPIEEHLIKSKKFYDSGDFKNSIKESISAIECLLKNLSGKDGAELSKGLAIVSKELNIDNLIKESILKLYNFASDAGGVRHGNKTNPQSNRSQVYKEDALFFYKISQSVIEYLLNKKKFRQENKKIA